MGMIWSIFFGGKIWMENKDFLIIYFSIKFYWLKEGGKFSFHETSHYMTFLSMNTEDLNLFPNIYVF